MGVSVGYSLALDILKGGGFSAEPVLRIRIRDPGSGAFLPPGSGIRDPEWSNGRIRIRDPG
jgi:hypothetical protein